MEGELKSVTSVVKANTAQSTKALTKISDLIETQTSL